MVRSQTSQDIAESIVKKLVAEYEPERVVLYGSYAYGNPDRDSDIDLLIIKETPDRFIDRWTTVHRILNGTHPSIPLEPVVLTPAELDQRLAAGDQFVADILDKGKVLYAR